MLSGIHWTCALFLALFLAGLGGARNARAQSGPHTETFETLREAASAPVLDDLEGLLARGRIRVAVTYSKTHYLWTTGAPDTRADPAARSVASVATRHRVRMADAGRPR